MISQYETNSHSLPRILTDQRSVTFNSFKNKKSCSKNVSVLAEKFQINWLHNKSTESKITDDSLTSLNWLHTVPSIIGPPSPTSSPSTTVQNFQSGEQNTNLQNTQANMMNSKNTNSRDNNYSAFSHLDCALKDGGLLDPLVRHDYKNNWSGKPPFSYATLICMAMRELNKNKITLSDIYNWITENFIYYRLSDSSWQNSVRHNLSLNKCFEKVPRGKDERGKGGFWRINPKYADRLESNLIKYRRQFPIATNHNHSNYSNFSNNQQIYNNNSQYNYNSGNHTNHLNNNQSWIPVAKSSNGLPAASTLLSRKLMMMQDNDDEYDDSDEIGLNSNYNRTLPPPSSLSSHSILSSSDSVSSVNTIGSSNRPNSNYSNNGGPTTDTPFIQGNNNSSIPRYLSNNNNKFKSTNNSNIYLPNLPMVISQNTNSFKPNTSLFNHQNHLIPNNISALPLHNSNNNQLSVRAYPVSLISPQHHHNNSHTSLDEFRTSETGQKVDTQIHHRFTNFDGDDDDEDEECEEDEDNEDELRVSHHHPINSSASPTIYSLLQHDSTESPPSLDEIDSAASSSTAFDTDNNHHHHIHHQHHIQTSTSTTCNILSQQTIADNNIHIIQQQHLHSIKTEVRSDNGDNDEDDEFHKHNHLQRTTDVDVGGYMEEESDEYIPHRDPLFDSVNSQLF